MGVSLLPHTERYLTKQITNLNDYQMKEGKEGREEGKKGGREEGRKQASNQAIKQTSQSKSEKVFESNFNIQTY